jgi:16S rRNA (guanine966-N2)-methyltransferase
VGQSWLTDGGVVVVERATRSGGLPWPAGLAAARSRRYGETTLWYGHATASGEEPSGPVPAP